MHQSTCTVVCFIVSIICINEAAKILAVFPTPSISHQIVFRPLINELVKCGHNVVVITTDPEFPKGQAPENLTEIDVHDISYEMWRTTFVDSIDGETRNNLEKNVAYVEAMANIIDKQTQIDEVQDILQNQTKDFDLLILETWTVAALGYSHAIKAPVIQFASFGPLFDVINTIGAAYHPLLYPQAPHTKVYNLSCWERIQKYYDEFWFLTKYYEAEKRVDKIIKRTFGSDAPPLSELKNNIQMMFFNIHPIWEGNRPVPPGVLYVPGLHEKKEKELPTELKSYLDSSVHGVIYISFGTNVNPSSLPPEKIQILVKAVSELPYDVLWKWDDDELPGRTKNIRISKWLPQSDLLRHSKIKLFIMQGGLQSTDEAITAGVPLIGIPMVGDQWFNTEKFVHHKIGLEIRFKDLNVESFKKSVKAVIEDKSYRENVARLRSVMHDQPMPSLERAVWWTEHVLRHGGASHLRAPAANMSWTQYYELDLVFIVLGTTLSLTVVTLIVVFNIIKLILRQLSTNLKVKNS